MKRFLVSLLILGFAVGATLGLFAMNHNNAHSMNGSCPTALFHASVCPDGALSAVQHYISMYQAFTAGLVSSIVTQVLMVAFLFVAVAYVLRRYIISAQYLFILSRIFSAKLYRPQAIIRWLSLLVNSPSLS